MEGHKSRYKAWNIEIVETLRALSFTALVTCSQFYQFYTVSAWTLLPVILPSSWKFFICVEFFARIYVIIPVISEPVKRKWFVRIVKYGKYYGKYLENSESIVKFATMFLWCNCQANCWEFIWDLMRVSVT